MPATKGRKRRQQILNTARSLFATKGYANVTMGDIALDCNVARTTLYEYFPTKEDILIELLDEVVTAARTTEATGDTPYDKLCSLACDSLSRMKENRLIYRIVFQETSTFSGTAVSKMVEMSNRWGSHVRRVVEEGKEELRSSLSIDDVVFAYQSLVGNWGRVMALLDEDFDVAAKAQEIVSILWFGVKRGSSE